jgi:hypothetical protein
MELEILDLLPERLGIAARTANAPGDDESRGNAVVVHCLDRSNHL